MSGTTPGPDTFIKKPDDPGYIVAWKNKYGFEAGKFTDEVMTYAEAKRRADELNGKHDDKVFWPENIQANPKFRD